MELSVTQILQLLCTSGHFHDCCREFEQCRRNLNPRGDGDDDEGDDDEDDDDDDDNDDDNNDDGDGGGDDGGGRQYERAGKPTDFITQHIRERK